MWVCGERGEVDDQEDETVFAAVVGEGEGGEAGRSDVSMVVDMAFEGQWTCIYRGLLELCLKIF